MQIRLAASAAPWRSIVLVVAGAVLAGGRPVFAQSSAPADRAVADAVARPISPGAVALLLPHAGQPAAIERLSQALADPRPDVRAVAARIAFTTRQSALTPALAAALPRERSPLAGAELVRALTLLQGAAADEPIRAALPRFDARAPAAWLETTSRTRPEAVWSLLDAVPDTLAVGRVLAARAEAAPEAAAAAFASLATDSARVPAFLSIVRAARMDQRAPSWPVLKTGLDAGGAPKLAAVHALLRLRVLGVDLPTEAIAYVKALTAAAPNDVPWLPIYLELMTRRDDHKPPQRALVQAIGTLDRAQLPDGLVGDPILSRLDAAEAAAFARVAGTAWHRTDEPVRVPSSVPFHGPAGARIEPRGSLTRQARPVSASLLKDLLAVTGCRPAASQVAVMKLTYRPTGQVRGVTPASESDPIARPECRAAALAIAAIDGAPGGEPVPDGRTDRLVIGLRPSDLECERDDAAAEPPVVRLGEGIDFPNTLRRVSPKYPQAALAARVSGSVLVDYILPVSGCVAEAYVSRRLDPALDVAAIAAVSEWRYAPAVRDGAAVPVQMTMTLTFGPVQ